MSIWLMFVAIWMAGAACTMRKLQVHHDSYRIIPSHFPPISLFENLLDPAELDAAYALEGLTNDRLRDQAGDISLVAPEDRVSGHGSTPIMAAFTHVGVASRFTRGRYGVYYAGLSIDTALAESAYSRARFLSATNETAQVLSMRCYRCTVQAALVDLRGDGAVHTPNDFSHAQAVGEQLKNDNELGALYRSVRHDDGECVAIFRAPALIPPAIQAGHYQFHWDGKEITHVLEIANIKRL